MRKTIFMLFAALTLIGCGGGGGSSGGGSGDPNTGPGDTGNYFPLAVGNSWEFRGVSTESGLSVNYTNSARITGTRAISGVIASIISESNPGNSGTASESYVQKNGGGITNWGNNDSADTITPQLIPYQEVRFPLAAGQNRAYSRQGLDLGMDLDDDGRNETFALNQQTTVDGFETVTVPVGTFPNCVKIRTTLTITVTLSRTAVTIDNAGGGITTSWYAPGVGPVKNSDVIIADGVSTGSQVEELIGFNVDGRIRGIQPKVTLAAATAPADSDSESPGKAAIGFDGSNYLLVSARKSGTIFTISGQLISSGGIPVKTFDISSFTSYSQNSARSAVAFDGTDYLVVFEQEGQIIGQRVTSSGTVLGAPGGFAVSSGTPYVITNFNPTIAFDGVNYLVVWQKFNSNYDIFAARVSPDGTVLNEFPVCALPGEQVNPTVAFDGANHLILWRDTRSGSGPAADTDIYGARVTPAGAVLDPVEIPISTASGVQDDPHVIFDGTRFFAVWLAYDSSAAPQAFTNVHAARIGTDGGLLDGPASNGGFAINSAPWEKSNPAVTFDGTAYLVIWAGGSYSDATAAGIYGARVSTTGTLLSGSADSRGIPFSGAPSSYSRLVHPALSGNRETGSTLLAWGNNIELSGAFKSIEGAMIYPFVTE